MKVVFAPDWRRGVAYQQMLADALGRHEVEVRFLSDYRRVLPLTRGMRDFGDAILHLHWPEPYILAHDRLHSKIRSLKFPLDIRMATGWQGRPLAVTAHNLWPHDTRPSLSIKRDLTAMYRRADIVFAHSPAAAGAVEQAFPDSVGKLLIVPLGDISPTLPRPVDQKEARRLLGLPDEPFCLMFGAMSPYKGVEELIGLWKFTTTLRLVGSPSSDDYAAHLVAISKNSPQVIPHLGNRISEEELGLWLSATSACVFNFTRILSSASASLARSQGVPVILPKRLSTLDLGEPNPSVFRFEDHPESLKRAVEASLHAPAGWALAADYREHCSWDKIAVATKAAYEKMGR